MLSSVTSMGLVLLPVQIAGDYLGQEMGLALAAQSDPASDEPVARRHPALSDVGRRPVPRTRRTSPVSGGPAQHVSARPPRRLVGAVVRGSMVTGLGQAQEWGLMLAAPVGAVLFLTSVVLALLTRAAPQMNLFSVGFGLRVGIGLAAVFVLCPTSSPPWCGRWRSLSALMERLVYLHGGRLRPVQDGSPDAAPARGSPVAGPRRRQHGTDDRTAASGRRRRAVVRLADAGGRLAGDGAAGGAALCRPRAGTGADA